MPRRFSTNENDRIRLRHMLDAALEAEGFLRGRVRADLDNNRMLALALVRLIEIIGEAATRVSDETRKQIPDVPWVLVVGMRNRLIHGYFDVDLDRVWDTVGDDLPPLMVALEVALSSRG